MNQTLDSRFYYPLKLWRDTSPFVIDAPFVGDLGEPYHVPVVVLSTDKGAANQGMYLRIDMRWYFVLPMIEVSHGVVVGYDIDIHYMLTMPVPVKSGTKVFRNGSPVTVTELPANTRDIWAVMTPSTIGLGTVNSVNDKLPGAGGNVEIGIADIPGLPDALEEAGKVKTVNTIGPDLSGNVEIPFDNIQGFPVVEDAPLEGQVLIFENGAYRPKQLTMDDIEPAFSVTLAKVGPTSFDAHTQVVNPQFTIGYSAPPANSRLVVGANEYPLNGATSFTVPETFTGDFGDSVQFTVYAQTDGPERATSVVLRWLVYSYWGATTVPAVYDEAFIEALTGKALSSSRNRTITVDAQANQYIYYAFKASFGEPTFTVGGFSGGFELVASDVPVITAEGYPDVYNIWKSENPDLGPTTVVIT